MILIENELKLLHRDCVRKAHTYLEAVRVLGYYNPDSVACRLALEEAERAYGACMESLRSFSTRSLETN